MSQKPTCSVRSAAVGEQLVGSAPLAVAWLALEQSGPWGAKAFTSSHLDPALGASIERTAGAAGVRPCLVRRVGRHADDHHEHGRQLLIAFTEPGRTWLLSGRITDPAAVLGLDWAAITSGDADAVRRSLPVLSPLDQAQLLVCTNGTRDLCCASFGRPVAVAAAKAHPEQVWEVTHTSGHRFAPTSVLLPSGVLHGRLDGDTAIAALEAEDAGKLSLLGYRGRSTWPPEAQAVELAVREETGDLELDSLNLAVDGEGVVQVRHRDGRTWVAGVSSIERPEERPESCVKDPKPVHDFVVTSLLPTGQI